MDVFVLIAERRIQEAIDRGEFNNLPNAGKPLRLEDDTAIPAELRMAYRILGNAGYVPPEIDLLREISSLRQLIEHLDEDHERMRRVRELNFKLLTFNELRRRPLSLDTLPEYETRVLDKLL